MKQADIRINDCYAPYLNNTDPILLLFGSAGCFAKGTLVQTSNGLKAIDTISKGEQVLSFNHKLSTWEYKTVLETFRHKRTDIRQKMLKFILSNGDEIHCTYNHEFYDGRDYVSAIELAKRAMGASSQYKPTVLHKHFRKASNNRLEGYRPSQDNEACFRWQRLSANNDKKRLWQNRHNQNAQVSSAGLLTQSRKLTTSKPQGWSKDQQCGGKLGMDEPSGQRTTQFCNRLTIKQGFQKSNCQTNRGTSQGNKGYLLSKELYQKSICRTIWSGRGHNQRSDKGQLLDTREIKSIIFGIQQEYVYDLCVEDNNNYTIGSNRYLVHNSGKSVFACQKLILRMLTEKGHKFLAVRKFYATLRTSCYAELKAVIDRAGIGSYFTMGLSPLSITCKATKSTVIFRGIDDPEKIKSISGITGIWVEEANELSEDEFDQLQLRLRGQTFSYKQTIVTFNPVVETHWLKTRYFDNNLEGVSILKTTYLDNAFIGAEYGAKLRQLAITNPDYYRIYALGEWGKIRTGQEFYKNFNAANLSNCNFDSNLPLHLSFDFNVVPYVSCIVSQVVEREGTMVLQILEEITLSSPNNTTKALCQRFKAMYPDCRRVYVYGDPAGNHRDTRSGGSDYSIIMKELEWCNPINRVATSAPKLYLRNLFINNLLANQTKGKLAINANCKLLIKDLEQVVEAADGTKLKKKVRDKQTNQSYEEVGHLSDCLDYLCCRVFEAEFLAIQGKKIGYSIA